MTADIIANQQEKPMQDRINDLSMTVLDCIQAIAGGNPGAVLVCCELLRDGPDIDPQNALGGLGILMGLDSLRIYGSHVWLLYKDVCRENLVDMIGVMRAVQLGHLRRDALARAMDGDRVAVDVPSEMAFVRGYLSEFRRV